MRQEKQSADDDRRDRAQEDHSRRDVLRRLRLGTPLGRGEGHGDLDPGVEALHRQHERDGEDEDGPLHHAECERRSEEDREQGDGEVHAEVSLRPQQFHEAVDGISEGFQQCR